MGDPWLGRLAAVDTGAVSDVLDRRGERGVLLGLSRLSGAGRVVGRATTVRLVPDDGRTTSRHLCTAAVEASDAGNVIVIDHGGRTDVAGWGGLLAEAATLRGVAGVVIDGACRDLDEVLDHDLPLWGRGAVPVTARGRVVEDDWNSTVEVCGVLVRPGDYLLADGSGIVVIRADDVAEVVEAAEAVVEKERVMGEALRRGAPVSSVMGQDYESLAREVRG